MKNFHVVKKKQQILAKEPTTALAFEFKDYLLCAKKDGELSGTTGTSAPGIIKRFRTIFDGAVDEGLLERDPFKIIKLKNRSSQKPWLPINQVKH